MKTTNRMLLLVALFVWGAACADATSDESPEQVSVDTNASSGGKGDSADGSNGFSFQFQDWQMKDRDAVKTDHLGLSLLATALLNRSNGSNCRGAVNQLELLNLTKGLINVHRRWADEVQQKADDEGFELCLLDVDGEVTANNAKDFLTSTPCTLQSVWRRSPPDFISAIRGPSAAVCTQDTQCPSTEECVGGTCLFRAKKGPRLVDLITPDVATVDTRLPGGFPNGRALTDQISGLFTIMGMVKLSEEVPLDDVQFLIQENDKPFRNGFPYLAEAHPFPQ